jgi:hypothetical protein
MTTEVLLYGEIIEYDACSSIKYKDIIKFYKNIFVYS